jgi:AraC family transcriptional regulator of adaptative response/methylated-DNA-[protein]-cysteine methyltransferase
MSLVRREIATPLGPMLAVASRRGICFLEFRDRGARAKIRALGARRGLEVETGASPHLDRLGRELDAYFAGRLRRFRVPLDLAGTAFQKSVWARLTRVPYGVTRSYAQIAAAIGQPAAFRAVGHANGRNPVSIVVPCHRLVGAEGALRGYGGGLWRKRRLLELERRAPRGH